MRTYASVSVVALLTLAACGSSNPAPAPTPTITVYQGGYSYDPPNNADYPVPVFWNGVDVPTKLPMLSYLGECPPAGSVQAMTLVNDEVILVGLSSLCFGGNQNMKPVVWHNGLVTQLGYWDSTHVLGLAKGVTTRDGSVYVVGAEGAMGPLPTLWIDGWPTAIPLPEGFDAGEVQSIVIEGNTAYMGAILSDGDPGTMTWAAGYWTLDLASDLTTIDAHDLTWTPLPYPAGANGVTMSVPIAIAGTDVWAAYNVYAELQTTSKPAVSLAGAAPAPLIDFAFGAEPYGEVHGLAATGASMLAVGYRTLTGQYGYPGPVYWQNRAVHDLSTADATLGIGDALGLQLAGSSLYVTGMTFMKNPSDPTEIISVPAYWVDGVRHDRQGLATTGSVTAGAVTFGKWPRWPASSVEMPAAIAGYRQNISQAAVAQAVLAVTR
jgi:hypothetical protein